MVEETIDGISSSPLNNFTLVRAISPILRSQSLGLPQRRHCWLPIDSP